MVHVYHGEGKGKTTAAMGLAVRSAGCGNRVVIVQFLKGSQTGELSILQRIPEIRVLRNKEDLGFVWTMSEEEKERTKCMHNDNLKKAMELVAEGNCDLLVLDELSAAYRRGLIEKDMVQRLLETRTEQLEIVITGRNPDALFIEHADYITEMRKERHPYEKGIPARRGVEF
ncbi:MAG: cob(I)yrinic acid a,c-diamide adenosyltransferase [bacterium]|nr:cob(I)yrinic acid a,c-diamide adenosyltransferase [bacterium]